MSKINLDISALSVESFDVAGDPSQWLRVPLTDDAITDCCDENAAPEPVTAPVTPGPCCQYI